MRAYSLIRNEPWYRRQAFDAGLAACGYDVRAGGPPDQVERGDVLLIWNRYAYNHEIAAQFEKRGGTVLVAENGYLGKGGSSPKFDVHPGGPKPFHYYALAVGYHNGAGQWPEGDGSRFAALEVDLKPWVRRGEEGRILVCPNRSFGVGAQIMHPDWATRAAARLRTQTKRQVVVRAHPGNDRPKRGINDDLVGTVGAVVWSSSVAQHALAAGIPTWIEAPNQIMKAASASGPVGDPDLWDLPDRLPVFERMAWAQWTLGEIEMGTAFYAFQRAGLLLPPAG